MGSSSPVRLGLVLPSANTTLETEIPPLLPNGVSCHFQRFTQLVRDTQDLDPAKTAIAAAASTLAAARVQAVGVGYTAGSFFGGPAWDAALRDAIADVVGVPTVTAASSIVDVLNALQIKTVAVVSPYASLVNHQLAKYLHASGLQVSALTGEPPTGPAGEVPLDNIRDMVGRLDLVGADGVLISCTGLRTLSLITELEQFTQRPVVSSNQALLWSFGRVLGIRADGPGEAFRALPRF